MTVYKGVLHELSEGEKISSEGTGGFYTHRMGTTRWHKTGVDPQAGMIRREILRIGDTRIRQVMLTPMFDTLLREAIGKEVALSVSGDSPEEFKRHTVLAIRTPDAGVVRPPVGRLIAASIIMVFRFWIVAIVGGFLVTIAALLAAGLVSNLVGDDEGYVVYAGFVVGGLFVLYFFLLAPIQLIYKTFKLRNAPLKLDGELVEGFSAADSAY